MNKTTIDIIGGSCQSVLSRDYDVFRSCLKVNIETGELIQYAQYDITAAMTPILPAAAIGILTIGVNFVVDWFLYLTSGLKDEHK